MKPVARSVLCGLLMMLAAPTVAQPEAGTGFSTLTGTVIDSQSRKPVPDVTVTVTSPALRGEQTAVTDARGNYSLPRLPPGLYTLRFEKEPYRVQTRVDLQLREKRTLRVNVELTRAEGDLSGRRPTTDVGFASTRVDVDEEFLRRIALAPPADREDPPCVHESLAEMASGARDEAYGVSINRAASP
ncbi:carboxypeptidase-like regulatory domain-containing protein [Pyxidicoccus sp. 3LG]